MKIDTTAPKSQELDITQEKRELEHIVLEKEQELSALLEKVESLKREISDFQELYDLKIRKLYMRLEYLEEQLFKFRNISEVVDNLFSFSEAQEVFEETMKSKRARMEEEYDRVHKLQNIIDKKNSMSENAQKKLKLLYRKLARLFHPDRLGGDDKLMILINKAYAEADLEFLRNFELDHVPTDRDDHTLHGLLQRLSDLNQLIDNAGREMKLLRKHDMYIMQKNITKSNKSKEDFLNGQAKKIRNKIMQKQEELEELKEKFGQNSEMI